MKPKIEIDKEAIRFYYCKEGHNLFWKGLFLGSNTRHGKRFQDEIMEHLFNIYNECIKKSYNSEELIQPDFNIEPPEFDYVTEGYNPDDCSHT